MVVAPRDQELAENSSICVIFLHNFTIKRKKLIANHYREDMSVYSLRIASHDYQSCTDNEFISYRLP